MIYIYDSSFVGALIIPDEKNEKVEEVHTYISEYGEKYAPQLIWYEIANVFYNLIRRKRYTPEEVSRFFPFLVGVKLLTDFESGANYSKKIFNLCIECNLSSYDAAYLELAERKKAILCTLDDNLLAIAKKRGVEVI